MMHGSRSLCLLGLVYVAGASAVSNPPLPLEVESIGRQLNVGDFAIVNEVFKDVEFAIEVADPIVIGSFLGDTSVQINNLVCRKIDIGDVTLTYGQPDATSVAFNMNVIQFDIQCSFDYTYDAPLGIGGGASASLFTDDSTFAVDFLLSQPESALPPNNLVISNCVASIVITNIDFSGGIVATFLDIIETSLRGLIAEKIKAFLCDYMTDVQQLGIGFLANVTDFVEPYLNASEGVDPLAAEIAFNQTLEPNVTLINFKKPEGALGLAVTTVLNEGSRLLGEERSDANSPTGTGKDIAINMLLRDSLLDSDRAFEISTDKFGFLNNGVLLDAAAGNISEVEIRIDRVKIQGLDTFTRFDTLDLLGDYTLQGSFAWQYMILEFDVYFALGPPGSDQKVEETITVSTRVDDLEFSFAALVAINDASLGALAISKLLQLSEIIPCVFSTAEALKLTSLNASIGSISDPVIQDFESPGLARVLTSAIEGMYQLFDEVLVASLPGLFQTTLKDLLNEQIATIMDGSGCDPLSPPRSGSQFVDFRDLFYDSSEAKALGGSGTQPYGIITKLLRDLIDDLLIADDPKTGVPKINQQLIVPLTHYFSGIDGTWKFNGTLLSFDQGFSFGDFVSDVVFKVYDAKVENVDSISSPLVLLLPTTRSGSELDNNVTFGFDDRPLRASTRILLSVQGESIDVRDDLELSLNLVEAHASLLLLAEVMTPRLLSLPLSSLTNVNCWLATIPAPALDAQGVRMTSVERTAGLIDAMVHFKKLFLNVTCIDCTSPGMNELSQRLLSEDGEQETTTIANSLFDYTLSLLDGEFVQNFLDRAINEAPARCPTNPSYVPNYEGLKFEAFNQPEQSDGSTELLITLVAINAGIVMAFVIISYLVRSFVRRRNKKWLSTLPEEKVYRIFAEQSRERELATYLRDDTTSMFTSKDIPTFVRYVIPVAILGNIGLFLSGHLSIGGGVSVFVQFAEEELVLENVFTFSIAQSTIDLWNSGGKQLAILIIIFSGIWPYTKTLLTLVAWFLPPQRLSVARRGSLYLWLDVLAKWSSADIFVLVVSLVAFNIKIQSPDVSFLPDQFYSIELMLIPLWGLYANLIAQLVSQVSSHVIIHYHRKIIEKSLARAADKKQQEVGHLDENENMDSSFEPPRDDHRAPSERLFEHGFLRPHRGFRDKLTIRRGVNVLLIGTSVALTLLLIVGCTIPAFSFEQLGLLGVAVEIGRNTDVASNSYSVFGIAETLFNQGLTLGTGSAIIGMLVISILIIGTVFVVPLVQVAVLLYQWFRPLKQMQRGKLEVFVEILSAWQYVEVFVIAVMISVWQLGPTSEFLINEYCAGLTDTFNSLAYYGILKAEDAQCFKLSATIENGCYILIACAFLLAFLNTFVPKAVFQYQRDMLAEERRRTEPSGPDERTQHIADTMKAEEVRQMIQPTPVLFSDTFRWLLDSTPCQDDVEQIEVAQEESLATSSKGYLSADREDPMFLPELMYRSTASSTVGSRRPSVDESASELASYGVEYEDEITL